MNLMTGKSMILYYSTEAIAH